MLNWWRIISTAASLFSKQLAHGLMIKSVHLTVGRCWDRFT